MCVTQRVTELNRFSEHPVVKRSGEFQSIHLQHRGDRRDEGFIERTLPAEQNGTRVRVPSNSSSGIRTQTYLSVSYNNYLRA